MPLFEYTCNKCNEVFDSLENKPNCPKCASGDITKNLSVPNFCIKGSCSNPLPIQKIKQEKQEKKSKQVLLDWICPKCNYIIEDDWNYPETIINCPECNTQMKQKLGRFGLDFKYNPATDICDWNGNSSQYWSEVKKQRRQGKNVKGFHEK